jgi:glycine dehydrogenase subunit 2
MRMHGVKGIRENSINAVLNARYLRSLLEPLIPAAKSAENMHEFILTLKDESRFDGLTAMTIAKNLLDHGFHAPTVYFPLIVRECMMIEPTETESRRTLDAFADAVAQILKEYQENREAAEHAPHTLPVKRLDEVGAARNPDLTYKCLG